MSHSLIVTLPRVTFFMLKPTVGIISSVYWPDYMREREEARRPIHQSIDHQSLVVVSDCGNRIKCSYESC